MRTYIHTTLIFLALFLIGSNAFAQQSAEDYFRISQTRLMNRDLDGALQALNKAIEVKPDFAQAYAQRSRLLLMKGSFD